MHSGGMDTITSDSGEAIPAFTAKSTVPVS